MKSHHYEFHLTDLARLAASLLIPMVVWAALARLGALTGVLPPPWPALDVDHTILTHQAEASRQPTAADLLFLGDSACLMDVSASTLESAWAGRRQVRNLGSFMYVGWNGYAALLARYADANPGRLRTVVVLVHPEMLRGPEARPHYQRFLSDYYAGVDPGQETPGGQCRGLFGLDIIEARLLSRLPLPLAKDYGRYYGFNLDLYHFMEQEHGSALDPHRYTPAPGQGNAEYRLAPSVEPGCRSLKAAIPPNVKVLAALAPIPTSFAPPGYAARWQTLLHGWGAWLQADLVLTNLPSTLPDAAFASTTHLNAQGRRLYTDQLRQLLDPEPERP